MLFTATNLNLRFLNSSPLKEEYSSILIFIFFAIFLSVFILLISYLLVTQQPETEKLSTYECGFEPYGDSRSKFNVKFYIVAILFILFDLEVIFLLPWCNSLSQINLLGFWSMIEFLFELGVGFLYVWSVGSLNWK